jgi:hypothetical protein
MVKSFTTYWVEKIYTRVFLPFVLSVILYYFFLWKNGRSFLLSAGKTWARAMFLFRGCTEQQEQQTVVISFLFLSKYNQTKQDSRALFRSQSSITHPITRNSTGKWRIKETTTKSDYTETRGDLVAARGKQVFDQKIV